MQVTDHHHPLAGLSFVDALAARGRATFTTDEAVAALGSGLKPAQGVLRRLRERGEIATPVRGFHVIVPPEYRSLGCRPAIQIVDALAAWLGTPYYLALLSAAEIHGAAHQRPQRTQVMVPETRRPVRCGGVHIEFIARQNAADMPVVVKNTPTGTVRVATPEVTALDLAGYPEQAGNLGNVATVLRELAEELSTERLLATLPLAPAAWGQRLGHLLEVVGAAELADAIRPTVMASRPGWVPLDPRSPRKGEYCAGWRLILNTPVEPDE